MISICYAIARMFSKIHSIKNSIREIDGKIVSKNFAQVDIVFTFENENKYQTNEGVSARRDILTNKLN